MLFAFFIGKKDRYTLLSDITLETLREYYKVYKPHEYLFEGGNGREHLAERSIQAVLERSLKEAEIEKPVSMHTLRHSFATHPYGSIYDTVGTTS